MRSMKRELISYFIGVPTGSIANKTHDRRLIFDDCRYTLDAVLQTAHHYGVIESLAFYESVANIERFSPGPQL